MPELKGFERQNGIAVAVIDYPNARRFAPQADGSLRVAAAPRTQSMDRAGLQAMTARLERTGDDASFYVGVLSRLDAYEQTLQETAAPPAQAPSAAIKPPQP